MRGVVDAIAAVEFDHIGKVYPDGTRAVDSLTLTIEDGEFVVLVGPSGCGKTTALRMLAGLEDITEGVMSIGDRVVNYVPARDRDIAMVFQSYALYPHLSVYENIAFGLRLKKLPKREIEERVSKAAATLGLADLLTRKPRNLSGGQRQRVAMGRAIVREPAAFLMDEPLSNLDAKLRVQMRAEISRLQHDLGTTTLYVTHDQVEAMTMGDRVAVMRKGKLQQVASPQELYDRPLNLFVGGFIGSPSMNMLEATVRRDNGGVALELGGSQKLTLASEDIAASPAIADYDGLDVIVGIRPEALEELSQAPDTPAEHRLSGRVELRESLGSELVVHFALPEAALAQTEETEELARESSVEGGLETEGAHLVGRFGAARPGRGGTTRGGCRRHPLAAFLRPEHRARDLRPGRPERSNNVRRRSMQRTAALAFVIPIALLAASCGGSSKSSSTTTTTSGGTTSTTQAQVSGSISFDGVWSGAEATAFESVIAAFNKQYPNVKVNYKSLGDNLPTVLSTAVAGGKPPDMADIAQPGTVKQFVAKGALKPIDYARKVLVANFNQSWLALGTFNQKIYGLVFKASNKSTVWYNVHAFTAAGVKPPTTWPQLLSTATTLKASGVAPYSIGGADGWTLTDLFENIYIRQAGPAKYAQLTAHKIPWTDPSVATAMKTMAQVIGTSGNMAGGTSGAIQTDFPTSVNNVFENPPKAAIVLEGDFVPGVATVKAKPGTDYAEFTFPSIDSSPPSVVIGGDTIVTFKDNPAIEAFMEFLGTPQAAEAWAQKGGFATGNRNMPASFYPDATTRATATAIASAKNVAFDMSDQQPAAFGATVGQGEWGLFQSFLRHPTNVTGIQQALESAATAAYKNGS